MVTPKRPAPGQVLLPASMLCKSSTPPLGFAWSQESSSLHCNRPCMLGQGTGVCCPQLAFSKQLRKHHVPPQGLARGALRTFCGGEVALIRVDRHQQRGQRAVLEHVRLDLVGPPSGRHGAPNVPPRAHAPGILRAMGWAPTCSQLPHQLPPHASSSCASWLRMLWML